MSGGKCPQHNSKTMILRAKDRFTYPRRRVGCSCRPRISTFNCARGSLSSRRHRALRWHKQGDNAQATRDRIVAQDEHCGLDLQGTRSGTVPTTTAWLPHGAVCRRKRRAGHRRVDAVQRRSRDHTLSRCWNMIWIWWCQGDAASIGCGPCPEAATAARTARRGRRGTRFHLALGRLVRSGSCFSRTPGQQRIYDRPNEMPRLAGQAAA